jgi:hypothetical protein
MKTEAYRSILAWEHESDVESNFTFFQRQPILALLPACFAQSGKIILWRDGGQRIALSHHHLNLDLISIDNKRNESNADETGSSTGEESAVGETRSCIEVLACRYEDDFSGPVGLRLKPQRHGGTYRVPQHGSRLRVVQMSEADAANHHFVIVTDMVINRNVRERRSIDRSMSDRVWVKFVSNEFGFSLKDAYPLPRWNCQISVFTPKISDTTYQCHVGGAYYYSDTVGMGFAVIFHRGGRSPCVNILEVIAIQPEFQDHAVQRLCRRVWPKLCSCSKEQIILPGKKNLEVKVSPETSWILEDRVYVISITVTACNDRNMDGKPHGAKWD